MLSRKISLLVAVSGLVAALFATPSAQTIPDQPVWFTFSSQVALPGTTLQPGQYEFRLSTSKSDRNIIEVYSKDTGKHVTTVMAVPASLSDAQKVPEKPEVRFYEVSAGTPPAVQSWWYPGIRGGHEFIYPREQAQVLAKVNKAGVLTEEGGKVTRMTAAEASAPPEPAAPAAAPVVAPNPTPTPTPSVTPQSDAGMNMNANTNMAQNSARTRRELPRTASELPFIAAVGVGSFFAGLALVMRRRNA